MKKYIGPIILIASIAGIGWLMLKRTANKVYVSLASVQFGSISALSIPFTLSINLVNDNDYPVNAGRLIGKLFYKNNFISDFSSENINIPAKSGTSLSITGNISTIGIAKNVFDLVTSKKLDNSLSVRADLIYENYLIPINTTLQLF